MDLVPKLWHLRDAFRAQDFDLRLVGGCVRDHVLGLPCKDVDLHTDATPEECVRIYQQLGVRFEPTGLQHGTITVILDHVPYEITSLRTDVETDGRHAQVRFTRDWWQDLARRDLTFNAMSMSFEGDILDPFGGEQDLKSGRVVFVGDAAERIQEDYLRILRWFRFRGRFGMAMDVATRQAVSAHAAGLAQISRERIWSEVSKILVCDQGVELMLDMHTLGVSRHMDLPDLVDWKWAPTIKHVNPDAVTLLVALYWHEAAPLLRTWKASSVEIRQAQMLWQGVHEKLDAKFCLAVLGWDMHVVQQLMMLQGCGQADLDHMQAWPVPVFPVKGEHLLKLGVKPGPEFGLLLHKLKLTWAASDYTLSQEDLLKMVT